ncbi:hypothetical protein [Sinorhizobium meliloti]|uniref:hypothetical protein n=1 Tax=Rhizobium meliloti TaxID=382 RepID=UPI0030A1F714
MSASKPHELGGGRLKRALVSLAGGEARARGDRFFVCSVLRLKLIRLAVWHCHDQRSAAVSGTYRVKGASDCDIGEQLKRRGTAALVRQQEFSGANRRC